MPGLEFFLYRATVHADRQQELPFVPKASRPEILRRAISEEPSGTKNRRALWGIANLSIIGAPTDLYFRLGRHQERLIPYANKHGDIEESYLPVAPYLHVICDCRLEVFGLAKDLSGMSPSVESGANTLARLLSNTDTAKDMGVEIHLSAIKEVSNYLARLAEAHEVRELWVRTPRPNPWDVEEQFVKPTAAVTERMRAENAKTTWAGRDLDVKTSGATDIIQTVASVGGDSGAKIVEREGMKPTPIRLGERHAAVKTELASVGGSASEGRGLLDLVRSKYHQIRGSFPSAKGR